MNFTYETMLRKGLKAATEEIKANNHDKGWYDNPNGFLGDMALLHSEVSEAVDAWRVHGTADATVGSPLLDDMFPNTLPKPEGVGSEFADIFIRLLDDCYLHDIDLVTEVLRKMAFNRSRPYRHGGKRA